MNVKHLLAIAAIAACGSSFAGPTVTNGGFEASSGDHACAADWTCSGTYSGGYVDFFGVNKPSFWNGQMSGSNLATSANGGNVVATWLIDTPNTIQQNVTGLTVGNTYNVSFQTASANRDPVSAGTGTVGWQVSMGGTTLGTANVAIAGAQSATPWSTFNYSFVATGASEVLKFLSVSSVGVAPEPILLLDGVTVAAVPEPSTYALMAGGLLAVVSIARRRQRQG